MCWKRKYFQVIWNQQIENKKQNKKSPKTKYLYYSFDIGCMNIRSHILWMFISITFILLFGVCCWMVFDPGEGRHKKTNNKGCCHEETCRYENKSFARRRGWWQTPQPWPNANKKSGPQLLREPKLLSFGQNCLNIILEFNFWALYFRPNRIGFSLGHVLGLRGNWVLKVILDQKGKLAKWMESSASTLEKPRSLSNLLSKDES